MRVSETTPGRPRPRRTTIVGLIVLVVVIVLVIVVQGLAGFYANFLWFHWSGVGDIWTTITATRVVLAAVFIAVAFVLIFGCLALVDIVVSRTLFAAPETELVRRYQTVVAPHSLLVRLIASFLVALALGASTASQWQHWILFEHAVPFHLVDPLFGRDDSFFVFRLPFLSFLVDWMFDALLVAFIVTAVAYFLNGAIRLQGSIQIESRAIAHLSLLLSLMALERAWAYYYVDRFGLDLKNDAYVAGAGYTDVHVRLPAIEFLAIVSLIAFVLLAINVYQRTWALPAISVGLWALLAIVVGVIVPALVQAVRVTPSQSTLEAPYIKDNILATRSAMNIANVTEQSFPANQDLTAGVLSRYQQTLNDVQVWDPTYSQPTFVRLQDVSTYYKLTDLAVDRYEVNGTLSPVVIGVRALNSAGLASATWVNTHLEYTHGYAAVVALANSNTATSQGGNPSFLVGGIPANATVPSLSLTGHNSEVYFAPGQTQYVIADSAQPEVFFQRANGTNETENYAGKGGIPIGGMAARLAFAIHLRDPNVLISSDINSTARLIYIPDVRAEVQKALPFLSVDSNPYPVIDNGQLDWLVDAYTTSDSFPYGQPADTSALSPSSGLQSDFNYVRDAVKVEVNAYTGKMTFFALDLSADPILESYEAAFPHLFQPESHMDSVLRLHLRYPQDLLTVQSATFGRYHVLGAKQFYTQDAAFALSQTSTGTNGSPSSQLPQDLSGNALRFTPVYELLQLPGSKSVSFDTVEPLVPFSQGDKLQTLSALLTANSSYADYGQINAYETATGNKTAIDGPGLANADILSDPTVAPEITLLDSHGSQVTLGTVQILPIADSLVYVRPLYVSSSQTSYPLLRDVVVVYGKQVAMAPTLDAALSIVFGESVNGQTGSTPSSGASLPSGVRSLIAQAVTDYKSAQTALASGDLGTYQSQVNAAGQLLTQADQLLTESGSTAVATVPRKVPASTTTSTPAATGPGGTALRTDNPATRRAA